MTELMIDGPAGSLEAHFEDAAGKDVAVLCHPHPQYGGSMHDMVLSALELGLTASGISSLRFNFRGVGRSAGSFDNGKGECEDLKAAVNWVRDTQQCERLLLIGYSFGGAVVLAAAGDIHYDQLLLVAPAIGLVGEPEPPIQPTTVVIGTDDQFIPVSNVESFFNADQHRVHVLDNTDHFFMGAHDRLTQIVKDEVAA